MTLSAPMFLSLCAAVYVAPHMRPSWAVMIGACYMLAAVAYTFRWLPL